MEGFPWALLVPVLRALMSVFGRRTRKQEVECDSDRLCLTHTRNRLLWGAFEQERTTFETDRKRLK
ncbi:hypothetical protein GCM10007148_28410 [Parvularcula lutaonensis]|nr:hypothetical protein GCM10007148_28410 [Parvularcula lutaonensis]